MTGEFVVAMILVAVLGYLLAPLLTRQKEGL